MRLYAFPERGERERDRERGRERARGWARARERQRCVFGALRLGVCVYKEAAGPQIPFVFAWVRFLAECVACIGEAVARKRSASVVVACGSSVEARVRRRFSEVDLAPVLTNCGGLREQRCRFSPSPAKTRRFPSPSRFSLRNFTRFLGVGDQLPCAVSIFSFFGFWLLVFLERFVPLSPLFLPGVDFSRRRISSLGRSIASCCHRWKIFFVVHNLFSLLATRFPSRHLLLGSITYCG